jgi:hypothetical protein
LHSDRSNREGRKEAAAPGSERKAGFRDEGHGFVRPENRLAFFAVAEALLAERFGGGYQPVGTDFAGSTIDIETGRELVLDLPT